MQTMLAAAHALRTGATSSVALVREALARIADPAGEGPTSFVAVHMEAALATATWMDELRRLGRAPSDFAGVPITIKDVFDEAGVVTRAGSVALADASPSSEDAPVVERLRRHGFVVLGRTNMSEFAFTGLGANPHYGTPKSPWDRATGRLPGGSSSGAAVAVADGIGGFGLGTDTGGSCRIPAALCGLVGWKPTARRVPLRGVFPLSPTLDSVGLVAPDVATCASIDAMLADTGCAAPQRRDVAGMRLGLPRATFLTDGLDQAVARAFERTLARLSSLGARIEPFDLPELADLPTLNAAGGFAAAESWAGHRRRIAEAGDRYDPMVRARIERGRTIGAADYLDLIAARQAMLRTAGLRLNAYDAVICPTVPIVPPPIAAIADPTEYNRLNMLLLRNTAPWNFLGGCAISLPIHTPGEPPVGLMLVGEAMADARILGVALALEQAISAAPRPPA